MRQISCLFVAIVCTIGLTCCDRAPLPPLLAEDIVITKPLPGRHMSAGYLSLTNNTNDEINITSVSSDSFARVQIHESTLENGIARMHKIEQLTLPAKSTVAMARGGKHLMLMNPLEQQDGMLPTRVTLTFFDGDDALLSVDASVGVQVPVENP